MTPLQDFWKWFIEHETDLMNFEVDREKCSTSSQLSCRKSIGVLHLSLVQSADEENS